MGDKAVKGLEALHFLIGTWRTNGIVKDEKNGDTPISGTDSYEWILDRKFILHKVNVNIGSDAVEAFEIICNAKDQKFILHSFDSQGVATEMTASFDENRILYIVGDKMRSRLVINDQNLLTAEWEKSEDNERWESWMELTLSK